MRSTPSDPNRLKKDNYRTDYFSRFLLFILVALCAYLVHKSIDLENRLAILEAKSNNGTLENLVDEGEKIVVECPVLIEPLDHFVIRYRKKQQFSWRMNSRYDGFYFGLEGEGNKTQIEMNQTFFEFSPDEVGMNLWNVIPFVFAKNGTQINATNCLSRHITIKPQPVHVKTVIGASAEKYKGAVFRELNVDEDVIFEQITGDLPNTILFVETVVNIRLDEMLKPDVESLISGGAKDIAFLALRSGTNTTRHDPLPVSTMFTYQTELTVHPLITTSFVNAESPETINRVKDLVNYFKKKLVEK